MQHILHQTYFNPVTSEDSYCPGSKLIQSDWIPVAPVLLRWVQMEVDSSHHRKMFFLETDDVFEGEKRHCTSVFGRFCGFYFFDNEFNLFWIGSMTLDTLRPLPSRQRLPKVWLSDKVGLPTVWFGLANVSRQWCSCWFILWKPKILFKGPSGAVACDCNHLISPSASLREGKLRWPWKKNRF